MPRFASPQKKAGSMQGSRSGIKSKVVKSVGWLGATGKWSRRVQLRKWRRMGGTTYSLK